MHQLYVVKRMSIKDMAELMKEQYNCKCTPQTLYNWLEQHDLLKLRGKGRKINISRGQKAPGGSGRMGPYAPAKQPKRPKPPWMH